MNDLSYVTLRNAKLDIANLLTAYEAKKSLRFSDFCEVWKEKKFSLIFHCGSNTLAELIEFTEEIFHMTKEYLILGYEFPIRIGALYMLYALYFKQPLKNQVKIRLIKSEWDGLQKLMDKCKQEKLYDIVLIHLKLFTSQAYVFTAIEREVGFELGFRKYFRKKNVPLVTSSALSDSLEKPLVEPNLIDNLSKLVSTYCQLKSESVNDGGPRLVNNNFPQMLIKKCEDFRNRKDKRNCQESSSQEKNSEDDDTVRDPDFTEPVPKKQIGRKRRRTKKQAYSSPEKKPEVEVRKENSSPPRKRRKASFKQLSLAKKQAQFLLAMKGLDVDPGPSTSAFMYDDMGLPEL